MASLAWSPYVEDFVAHEVAESLGMTIAYSYRSLEITDPDAVIAAGYVTKKPHVDRTLLRKALEAGAEVPGAKLGSMEYVLTEAKEVPRG